MYVRSTQDVVWHITLIVADNMDYHVVVAQAGEQEGRMRGCMHGKLPIYG